MKLQKAMGAALGVAIAASALPVFAQTASTTTSTPPRADVDIACVRTAIEKRENAVIAAEDAYAAGQKQALQVRRDALLAAWQLTDAKARWDAVIAAWRKHRDTMKQLRETRRDAVQKAWKQFKTDRAACGFHAPTVGEHFGLKFDDEAGEHGKFGKWWRD